MFRVPRLLKSKAPIGPKPSAYSYWWTSGEANPWKFRNCEGTEWVETAVYTVSTSEDWWAGVWEDIVSTHGAASAEHFWKSFAEPRAIKNREASLRGTAAMNWGGAIVAFNSARHEDYAREIGVYDVYPAIHESPETVSAMKRNLGEWLYTTIRSGDHGAIRKLSELVAGKEPPPATEMSGDEKYLMLQAFEGFLRTHFRLPTKEELKARIQKKGNLRRNVKGLGFQGLPDSARQ